MVTLPVTERSGPSPPSPVVSATIGEASRLMIAVDLRASTAIGASLWSHVGGGRGIGTEHLQEPARLEPGCAGRHQGRDLIGQARQIDASVDRVFGIFPDAEVEARFYESDVLAHV